MLLNFDPQSEIRQVKHFLYQRLSIFEDLSERLSQFELIYEDTQDLIKMILESSSK